MNSAGQINLLCRVTLVVLIGVVASVTKAQTRLEEAPINYLETRGENRVQDLVDQINSGQIDLPYEPGFGQVRAILDALNVPVSSQCLVYSKTSLQSARISPSNPRAIYFGDDVYVGWVRGSSLLEISTADPNLGALFYTIQMSPRRTLARRENYRCLSCHEKTSDHGKVPMHTVRSVATRESGVPNLLILDDVSDHTSPIEGRWGGWYVTGGSAQLAHLGNTYLQDEKLVSFGVSRQSTLRSQFELDHWPESTSDIVALMVMEHQTELQNRFADANYAVRRALLREANKQDHVDVERTVDRAAQNVVEHLLMAREASVPAPLTCSNSFVDDFQAQGPRTKDGLSLRDFDLSTRLFRHPCSYLIYSTAFDRLEPLLKRRVYDRLHDVLVGNDQSATFDHLSKQERKTILAILLETKQGLPANWRGETSADNP